MSALLTSTIEIRDSSYKVREMTGKEMQTVRKFVLSETEKYRVQAYVAYICCVEPKIASELDAGALPQLIVERISNEAFRLTKGDEDGEAKNA